MEHRKFTKDFKIKLLTEIQAGSKISQLAKLYEISASQIYNWQRQYEKYGNKAFAGKGNAYSDQAHIADLERKIGQLTMENELLKKANRLLQENCLPTTRRGGKL